MAEGSKEAWALSDIVVLVLSVVIEWQEEVFGRKSPLNQCQAGFVDLHLQSIRCRLDHERGRVFAVRVWVGRILRFQVHTQPHDCFLDFGDSEAAFTRRAHGMVWRTFSGVAFVTALLEALEAFVEVFAPLLRLEDKGFLLILVWCRVFHSSNRGVLGNAGQARA